MLRLKVGVPHFSLVPERVIGTSQRPHLEEEARAKEGNIEVTSLQKATREAPSHQNERLHHRDPKPEKKRRRGPDVSPRAPVPGDPNRGSHPTKDPHRVRPNNPPKKTALPGGGDPAARASGGGGGGPNDPARTFTGVAARNNATEATTPGTSLPTTKGDP